MKTIKNSLMLMCGLLFAANVASSQTTITIFSETFEAGSGTSLSGWNFANGTQTNKWYVGSAISSGGSRSAYVSSGTGYTYAYGSTSTVHLYRDLAVNGSATNVRLTFRWRGEGEGSSWDYMDVCAMSTSVTPAAGTELGTSYRLKRYNGASSWRSETLTLPNFSNSMRLVFSWHNDGSSGSTPIAIDNVTVQATVTPPAVVSPTPPPTTAPPAPGFLETFEAGSDASLPGWTIVNGTQTNHWYVGTAAQYTGTKAAYISNTVDGAYAYTTESASYVHLYRTLPSSARGATLTFYYKGRGEGSVDCLSVFLTDASTSIAAGSALSDANTSNILLGTYSNSGEWRQASITVPDFTGSRLLVFSWSNDRIAGTMPPIAIDDIVYTLTPAPSISIAGAAIAPKAYDGTTTASVTGVTFSGLPTGTTLTQGTDYTATAAFADPSVGTGKTVTVTVTLSSDLADAYTLASSTYQLTGQAIAKKEISIADATIAGKVYDGSNAANVASVTFGNLPSGETLTVDADYTATATFADASVGTGKTVNVAVTLLGDAANTYTLEGSPYQLTGQAIAKRSVTITGAAVASKTYDATNTATTDVTFGNLPSGEALTQGSDYTVAATFDNASVGTGKTVTVTVTLQGSAANTYTLEPNTYQLTGQAITKRDITITGAAIEPKAYNGDATASVESVTFGNLPGGTTLALGDDYTATAAFADPSVGTGKAVTVTVTLSSGAAGRYNLASGLFELAGQAIGPKKISIAGATIADKTYDGTATATLTGVTFDGLVGDGTLTVADYTATAAFSSADAGAEKEVTVSVALRGNATSAYTLGNDTAYTLSGQTIAQRSIAIAAINLAATKPYDGTTDVTVYSVSFKDSSDEQSIAIDASGYTVTASFESKNVGSQIQITGAVTLSNLNYTLSNASFDCDAGSITPKPISIDTVIIETKRYNGSSNATVSSVVFEGVAPTDTLKLGEDYSAVSAEFTNYSVGSNNTVKVILKLASTQASRNYSLADSSYTLQNQEILKVMPEAKDFDYPKDTTLYYNGAQQHITVAANANHNFKGVGVPNSYSTKYNGSATPPKNTGVYVVTVEVKPGDNNNNIDSATLTLGTLTILPKPISFTAPVSDKVYDGTDTATLSGAPVFTGLASGETLTKGQDYTATASFDNVNAGEDKQSVTVTVTLISNDKTKNYVLAKDRDTAYATITRRLIAIDTAFIAEKDYDGGVDATVNSVLFKKVNGDTNSGLVDGETLTIGTDYSASGYFQSPNAGRNLSVRITVMLNANSNYALSQSEIWLTNQAILKPSLEKYHFGEYQLSDATYDGTPHAAPVTLNDGEDNYITVTYNGETKVPVDAGTYVVKASISGSSNFEDGDIVLDTFTIAKRTISIDSVYVTGRAYDGTADVTIDSVTFANLASGETLGKDDGYTVGTSSYSDAAAGENKTVSGSIALTSSEAAKNYTLADASYARSGYSIAKAQIAIDTAFVAEKRFDGSYSATVDSVRFSGIVPGEALALGEDYSVDSAAFDSFCPGTNRKVTIKVALKENSQTAKNYDLSSGVRTLENQVVEKRKFTESDVEYDLPPNAITYNGAPHGITVALRDSSGGGSLSVTYSGSADLPVNVGSYVVKVSVDGDQNFSERDTVTLGNLTIVPDTVEFAAAYLAEKVYDGTDSATVDSVTFANGKQLEIGVDYEATASFTGNNPNAGSNKPVRITVKLKGNSYRLLEGGNAVTQLSQEVNATIKPRQIAIDTAFVKPQTYNYGRTNATVDSVRFGGVSGVTPSGLLPGETLILGTDYEVSGSKFDSDTAGANKTVTMTVTLRSTQKAKNYNLAGNGEEYMLTGQIITKKTVDANQFNNKLIGGGTYKGTAYVATVGTFASASSTDSIVVKYNGDTTPPVDAGAYTVTVDFFNSPNYYDTAGVVLGTLTISPRGISIDNVYLKKKVYDGSNTATVDSVTFDDVLPGHTLKIGTGYTATATSAGIDAGAQSFTATVTLLDSNYTLTGGATSTLSGSIEKRPLAIDSANVAYRVYDGDYDNPGAGVSSVRFSAVDSLPESGPTRSDSGWFVYNIHYTAKVRFTNSSAGTNKTVTMNVELTPGVTYNNVKSDNYVLLNGIGYELGGQEIVKAKPTSDLLTYNQDSVEYNGNPHRVKVELKQPKRYSGMENILVRYNGDSTPPTAVGSYAVTVDLKDNSNFADTLDLPVGTFRIVKGSIKIDTVFVGKKPYDGGTSVAVDSVRFSSSSSSSSAGEPRYLAIGSGYTATAAFEDSAIGTNKPVTATVTLLDAGYILTTAQYTFSGQIDRAKPTPEHFEFRWGDSSVDSVPYDGQEYYLSHSATAATTNPRAVLLKVKQEYEGMVAIKYAYHDSASLINAGSYPVHVSTFETATCDTVEKLLLNPFIISKATPTVENILFIPATDTVYDGNKHGLNSTVTWNTASGTAGYGTIGTTRTYTNIETNQATTTAPTNAGDYAISVDISEGANYYAAKLVLDTLTIAKKAITVDSIVISAKTYDGTDTAKVTKVAKFGGLVNISSNTLTLKTEYVVDSARFEDTKAGTSKKVKVYVRLTGGKAVNYVLDTANAKVFTQNVAQKKITSISAVVAPKTYDGTDTAIVESVTFNGILPADSLLLDTGYTVALAHFDSPNVSTKANKKVTVQVALAGVAAENYTLTKNSCTVTGLNISKATPDTSHLYFRIGDSKPYSGNGQGIDSVSFKEVYLKSATTAVKLGKITPLYNGQAAKPSGIGKYAVTVNIAESTNFEAVNNLPLDTFVITPGDNIKLHLLAADILPKHYDGTTAATVKNGNLTLAGVDTAAKEELFTLTPNTDFYVDSAWYADAGVRDSNEVFVRVKTINGLAKHYLTDSTNVFSIKVDSSIYPKPISIADANLAPKTYDGTDSATVDSVWFTGLVDGDTLRPNVHYTSVAAFTDSAAGSAKTVNLSVALKDTVRNYTLSSPSCKLTGRVIAQKEISIDTAFIAKKSYDGTTKVTVDSVRFKGLVDGDTLAKGTGYRVDTAFFDSITSGATRTVTIRLSLLEGGSYKLALADSVYALRNQEIGPAAAAKKDLYFTPMPDTMSYNGKGHPLTVAWSASATDTVGIKVTYSKKGGNATATDTLPVNVGTYYVFASVSGAANFGDTASIPLDTFTIVPDTLTITGAVIAQKTYDGTDTAKVSSVEFSGKVVGPVALKLGADYKVDSARFDDVHAGTEKDVALWVSLTDTSASANYVLGVDTFVLENQNIAQRPIQLVAAGLQVLPKFYDGTRYATIDSSTVKFSNLVEGDTLRWTVERAEFNDSIAKSGKSVAVTISLIPDSVSSSYTLTKGTATLTKQVIGKAHLTADMFVALDSSVTYDSKVHAVPKPALKPDVPGVISFTLMYGVGSAAPATAKPKDAGKHLIYAGFKGNTNYAPDTIVVDTFTIKPCPIAINKVTIGKGKSYDGTDTLQVGNVKSVTFTGLVGSQKITADGYTVDSARFVDKNAGDNKDVNVYVSLKADGSIAKNYVLDSNYIAGKIGISKREITIDTAFLAPKVYSGSDSSATVDSVRFGNLVAGDTLKLDVDYTALARYTTIDVAGGSSKANVIVTLNEESETAKNYTLSDTLYDELKSQPISRAAIKIASVSIKEKVYDGTDTAVVESITVSDTTLSSNANGFTLDTGDYTLISSTFDSKNAGSGKTLKVAIGLTEKGKEKYTLADTTYTLTGQSIGKATPAKEHFSVTLAHDTVTYGGDAPDFGLSVAWKPIYSDTGSFYVLYDGEPYSPYNVGKYYISLSVEGTDNFEAGVVDVDSVVIRPKEIAVDSAIIKAKTYNGTIAATVSEVIFTGLVPEDALDFETGIADGIYKASAKFDSASVVGAGNAVAVTVWLLNDHHLAKNYTLKGANSKGRVTDTITGQTISKKALTIASDSVTIVGKPYDGTKIAAVEDDTLTIDEGKFAGLVGNDTVYVVVDSARYSSASVSGATKVYVYATPYGKNADSYTVKTLTLTLAEPKIAKDTPSVAHLQFTPKDTTYVYGEKVAAVAKPKLKTGLSGAGTIGSVLYGNETYSDTTARPKDVGKYLVKVAVGGGANFEAGTVVFDTITIVQDTLNITGFAAKGMSKAYDGTDTADARKVTKVTFTSTRAGKAVSISTGHYVVDSAKFSSKNVSGDSTVTIYVSLNPDSATSKNYVLRDSSYSKMLDTIKQKPIDVSGATLVAGRVYNGTTAATADVDSVAFTGVVPGDTLALGADYAVDSAFFDDPAAGADKTLSVYVSLTGNAKNYRLRSDSIVLENQVIPKRTIYFDSIFVAAKVYDGTDTAKVDSVKFANLVAGDTLRLNDDYSVASARFSRKNAGDSSLTVSISLADSSKTAKNYQLAHADTTISRVIAKATPAPEHFDITGADAVYDGAKHAVTVAVKSVYEGFGTISGPNYLTGSTSTTTAPTAAGAYAVWVKVTKAKGGANFESADTVHVGTLTIAKKTISVDSVVFAAKTYDGTDTAKVTKVAKFGGLTSGSTLTIKTEYVVDSARFADTNAGANKDVKVYVRLTGTGKSANYVLDTSVVTLKHSVAQRKTTLSRAAIAEKTYDGTSAAKADSVFFSNVLPADSLLLDTGYTVVRAYFTNVNAGTNNRTATVKVALTGPAAVNYVLTKDSINVAKQTIKKTTFARDSFVVTGNRIAVGETLNVDVSLKAPYADLATVSWIYTNLEGTDTIATPAEAGQYLIVAAVAAKTAAKANINDFNGVVDTLTIIAAAGGSGSSLVAGVVPPPAPRPLIPETPTPETPTPETPTPETPTPETPTPETPTPETPIPASDPDVQATADVPSVLDAIVVSAQEEVQVVEVTGDTIYYTVPCGKNVSDLQVTFDKNGAATSTDGDTLKVDVSSAPSLSDIPFAFTLNDGEVKEYTLRVEKPFDFSSIVHVQLGGRMLLVVKNPESNGGYDLEKAIWQRKVGDEWWNIDDNGDDTKFFYVSPDGKPITDTIRVLLQDSKGDLISTCPYDSIIADTPGAGLDDAQVYPNPVTAGGTVKLQLGSASPTIADLEKIYTRVYFVDIMGTIRLQGKLSDLYSGLTIPDVASGTYLLVLEGPSARKNFKLTVE